MKCWIERIELTEFTSDMDANDVWRGKNIFQI